jgi:hypothetical protein
MLEFVVIISYKCDLDGVVSDEENDLISILVSNNHHDGESATEAGLLEEVLAGASEGDHIKFELFNVNYSGDKDLLDEVIVSNIKDNMDIMLENGELEYVNGCDFMATVRK